MRQTDRKKEAGERGGERKEQLIKASSFNNANVITRTGTLTCSAPNHINTGVVERKRRQEATENGDRVQIYKINQEKIQSRRRTKGGWNERNKKGPLSLADVVGKTW